MKSYYGLLAFLLIAPYGTFSRDSESFQNRRENHLTLNKQLVNITGKEVMGMTVNGCIPRTTLEFIEREQEIIHVTNSMDSESAIHWQGLVLPNFQDGVPYLTTPFIKPGFIFPYAFPIKQSATYLYHSHTMLQEQHCVYRPMVIHPKEKTLAYDKELVLLLSDCTDEKPKNVSPNLIRGTERYHIKKETATPLNQVVARGALGEQFNFWKQRMEGADIADV